MRKKREQAPANHSELVGFDLDGLYAAFNGAISKELWRLEMRRGNLIRPAWVGEL